MINVYKITTIKTLKIKTHISFINIHLKNLLKRLIINMNIKHSISAIKMTVKRIRRSLILKRKRKLKLKLRIISL